MQLPSISEASTDLLEKIDHSIRESIDHSIHRQVSGGNLFIGVLIIEEIIIMFFVISMAVSCSDRAGPSPIPVQNYVSLRGGDSGLLCMIDGTYDSARKIY